MLRSVLLRFIQGQCLHLPNRWRAFLTWARATRAGEHVLNTYFTCSLIRLGVTLSNTDGRTTKKHSAFPVISTQRLLVPSTQRLLVPPPLRAYWYPPSELTGIPPQSLLVSPLSAFAFIQERRLDIMMMQRWMFGVTKTDRMEKELKLEEKCQVARACEETGARHGQMHRFQKRGVDEDRRPGRKERRPTLVRNVTVVKVVTGVTKWKRVIQNNSVDNVWLEKSWKKDLRGKNFVGSMFYIDSVWGYIVGIRA